MIKRLKGVLKNQKGLTLVELLAVIVILGIIAAIAVPSIGKIIDNSKKDAHIANAKQIAAAARVAVAANEKDLWVSKSVTVNGTTTTTPAGQITLKELVEAGYMESVPKDPDGSNYNQDNSFVTYNESGTSKYLVYLDGSERDVEGTNDNSAVDASSITKSNVK